MRFTTRVLLLVSVAALLSTSAVFASGFMIPEQGAKASSMAGAFTAIADDPSAIFYNVAGIAQQRRLSGIAGATFITFDNSSMTFAPLSQRCATALELLAGRAS